MLDKFAFSFAFNFSFLGTLPCLDHSIYNIPSITLGLSRDQKPMLPENVFGSIQYNTELLASIKVGYAPIYDFVDNDTVTYFYGAAIDAEVGINGLRIDLGGIIWLRFFDVPIYKARVSGSWLRKWDGPNSDSNYYGVNTEAGLWGAIAQVGFYKNSKNDDILAIGIGIGL